ncbi:MAG TPA: futalosine hydrolase [Salinivirgaceae bacterium]|nr:futalosine hydrolase [Salinivirgaceae bacterium]HQA76181.1 futalosine hydrolase [Salinivirgaceae bacterium]
MTILIVAATFDEILLLVNTKQKQGKTLLSSTIANVDILVTGIGIAATIFNLTKCLSKNRYDIILNAGICGSYNSDIELGSVVEVIEDCFSDRIVETESNVISWLEAGFNVFDNSVEQTSCLKPTFQTNTKQYRKVKAITSDTVHANKKTIDALKSRFNPDIESMEGAAVFYVCFSMGIKSMQLRAVSNMVGVRDKREWKTELAINNLSLAVNEVVNNIIKK